MDHEKQERSGRRWPGLVLGGVGLGYIWTLHATGVAEFPHAAAALTVLIPLVLFGLVLRSSLPSLLALVLVTVIDLTL